MEKDVHRIPIDLKALMGDKSDIIPGAAKIGEKDGYQALAGAWFSYGDL